MSLRASIDDLDALIVQLHELRERLAAADEVLGLREAEAGLRHVAQRATTRAELARRALELRQEHQRQERRSA